MALSQLVAEIYVVSLQKSGVVITTFFSLHLAALFVQEKIPNGMLQGGCPVHVRPVPALRDTRFQTDYLVVT
jgi:hypothetical protein